MLSARPKESQGNSLATVLTDTKLNIFTASSKEATKEVARPKPATFVEAVNMVNTVAVKTVAREFSWDVLGRVNSKYSLESMYFYCQRSRSEHLLKISKILPPGASPEVD